MAVEQIRLTFPPKKIKEPVIYKLGHEFKVITNIRRANVSSESGWVDLAVEGDDKEIERAIAWLKKLGVRVDPVTGDIVEG